MDRTIKGPDGKMYPSISAMCRAYGISQALYYERQKRHCTKSLTRRLALLYA